MIDKSKFIETDELRIHETKGGGSYGIKLLRDGKTIGCAYVRPEKLQYHLYRVFVEESNRGDGLGKKLMDIVLENFSERDIKLSAYPNRISDYEERKQYYIKKLFEFYEAYDFKRLGKSHQMVRYSYTPDIEDLFE